MIRQRATVEAIGTPPHVLTSGDRVPAGRHLLGPASAASQGRRRARSMARPPSIADAAYGLHKQAVLPDRARSAPQALTCTSPRARWPPPPLPASAMRGTSRPRRGQHRSMSALAGRSASRPPRPRFNSPLAGKRETRRSARTRPLAVAARRALRYWQCAARSRAARTAFGHIHPRPSRPAMPAVGLGPSRSASGIGNRHFSSQPLSRLESGLAGIMTSSTRQIEREGLPRLRAHPRHCPPWLTR